MAGWFEGILINKNIYRIFGNMVVFRLHLYYVNLLISQLFITMLHNLNLSGTAGDDVITAFRQWPIIKGFFC
jgi:hypothetical protein